MFAEPESSSMRGALMASWPEFYAPLKEIANPLSAIHSKIREAGLNAGFIFEDWMRINQGRFDVAWYQGFSVERARECVASRDPAEVSFGNDKPDSELLGTVLSWPVISNRGGDRFDRRLSFHVEFKEPSSDLDRWISLEVEQRYDEDLRRLGRPVPGFQKWDWSSFAFVRSLHECLSVELLDNELMSEAQDGNFYSRDVILRAWPCARLRSCLTYFLKNASAKASISAPLDIELLDECCEWIAFPDRIGVLMPLGFGWLANFSTELEFSADVERYRIIYSNWVPEFVRCLERIGYDPVRSNR